MHVLAEIRPLNTVTGLRETLRVASSHDLDLTGFDGQRWLPALHTLGPLEIELFDGDFSSAVSASQTSFALSVVALNDLAPAFLPMRWQDAPVKLWVAGASGPVLRFDGTVTRFERSASLIKLTAEPGGEAGNTEVLNLTYEGTTGIEGDADLKGRLKPWLLGKCFNVEPVQINAVDNVYQVSAYGPIKAINALYERAAGMGPSLADYSNYAALVAADIPNGRWATCLTQGLIRLGAPAYGVITVDAEGDFTGGVLADLTGAVIQRVAAVRLIDAATVDTASLTALDVFGASLPSGGRIGIYLAEQVRFLELARRLCLPLNAQAGYSLLGKLQASRVAPPAEEDATFTLDALGRELPLVQEMIEADTLPPYKKIIMGGARSWRVHTFDEIATQYNLIDKGRYSPTETYREGNIVAMPDESRWLYESETATAGNAPATGSAYWTLLSDAVSLQSIGGVTTSRAPVPPESLPINSIHIDDDNRQFRFEGGPALFGVSALTVGGVSVNLPAYVDIQDEAISGSVYQIEITPPADQTVFADYLGAVLDSQFPRTLTPIVRRGGVDVRTETYVTYAITATGGIVATVNNQAGSPDKGRITVTSGEVGAINITVKIDGKDYGPYRVRFAKSVAAPPSSGGTGAKSAEDTTFPGVTSGSLAPVAGVMTVAVASGEAITCAFAATYNIVASGFVSSALEGRWETSPAGANTWTAGPAGLITGTDAEWYPEEFSGAAGFGIFNDTITGLSAGDYDVRFVGKLTNASGSPTIWIYGSTARVIVQ